MKIGVFGLGYVGLTTSACLLQRSFEVVGYERSEEKYQSLSQGVCPLSEPGVREAVARGLSQGTMRVARALDPDDLPDVLLICVGTPNREDGQTELGAVRSVLASLQEVASDASLKSEVVLRSTVPPGTLSRLSSEFELLFERWPIVFYPEFLREGTAMRDFFHPPQTVIGGLSTSPAPRNLPMLLTGIGLDYEMVDAMTAEALKFGCNAFHAVKVCFANEVGRLVARLGGDGTDVMRLLTQDTDLNISAKYLLPGAPYGGSCLPKDTRAFAALARAHGVPLSLISHCETSNAEHVQFIVDQIMARKPKAVAVLGIAFKRDTDDVRESPSLRLVEALSERSVERIWIHDFLVQPEQVMGVNKVELDRLLGLEGVVFSSDLHEIQEDSDVVLLMHQDRRYRDLPSVASEQVIDVSRWLNLAVSEDTNGAEGRR